MSAPLSPAPFGSTNRPPAAIIDFFAAKESAERRSRRFLALLAVCVVLVAASVALFVGLYAVVSKSPGAIINFADVIEHLLLVPWPVYLTSAVIAFADMIITGMRRMRALREGSVALTKRLGATRIGWDDHLSSSQRQLLNVVDEMSVAAVHAPPAVYVLASERAINGFCAANGPDDIAVILTAGAIEHLQRDELQGLLGFLLGQVANGDVDLNMRLVAWLAAVVAVADSGRALMRAPVAATSFGNEDVRKAAFGLSLIAVPIGAVLVVIGSMGLLLARIVRVLACRQRVFLNDATAVQFTRYPAAVADALRRTAAQGGGRLTHHLRGDVAHMTFVPVQRTFFLRTHPAIRRRVALIEPKLT